MTISARQDLSIYILECSDGTLYTGVTGDLARRCHEHATGTGRCKYTRSRRPVRLVRSWDLKGGRGLAMSVEHWIKRCPRMTKLELIRAPDTLQNKVSEALGYRVELRPSTGP